MVKIIFLILILQVNIFSQIELTSTTKYINIDGSVFCIIELNLENSGDSILVIYTNNWRLSNITNSSEKYLGFPVIPNLINRVIIHPSGLNLTKNYLGEDSNLGMFMKGSMVCLNPSDEITFNIVLQDSLTISLIKNKNYEMTYIYNFAYLSDIANYIKLNQCSDQKNNNFIIPLKPINSGEVRHYTIIENENFGDKPVDLDLNSRFKKGLITFDY